jgi:hypothetical protein
MNSINLLLLIKKHYTASTLSSFGTSAGDTMVSVGTNTNIALGFTFNLYGSTGTTARVLGSSGQILLSSRYMGVYAPNSGSYNSGNYYYRLTTSSTDLVPLQNYISATYSTSSSFTATKALMSSQRKRRI